MYTYINIYVYLNPSVWKLRKTSAAEEIVEWVGCLPCKHTFKHYLASVSTHLGNYYMRYLFVFLRSYWKCSEVMSDFTLGNYSQQCSEDQLGYLGSNPDKAQTK